MASPFRGRVFALSPEHEQRRLAVASRHGRGHQSVEQRAIDDAGVQRRRGQLARDDAPALGGRASRRRASGAAWLRLASRHSRRA
jgi:hypothetical protein